MKVVRWVTWEEGDALRENNHGGLGGFFDPGMRWEDYSDGPDEVADALREEILAKKFRFGGFAHQSNRFPGVPVFDDGSVFLASMRAWGDLMAAIWSTEENKDYSYCDFAWEDAD